MQFGYSDKTREAAASASPRSWTQHVYPAERVFADEVRANRATGNPWQPTQRDGGAEGEGARAGPVEPLPARPPSTAPASPTSSTRRCARSWAAPTSAPEVVQLHRARHRQHGSARALRHARAARSSGWSRCSTGKIRSAFAMTEPDVASSDATNIQARIERDGDHYVINGRKWWTTGAPDPRCKILIFMGKTDPDDRQQAPAAVDDPGAAGHAGREDAARPHRLRLRRRAARPRRDRRSRTCACRPPTCCWARAAASRSRRAASGPGRIHHCMRLIGVAERALELMCKRVEVARRLRQARRRAGRDARAHRRTRAS